MKHFTFLKPMLLLCALIVGVGTSWADVTDELTVTTTGVSGTNYTAWSGKTATSEAVYAGQSAGGNSAIQLRSSNSNSGVITTASGGHLRSITVVWNSNTVNGRTINIYGKNTAYSAATDLYEANKQGTLLGTIVKGTSTSLTVSGDYQYFGIRSNSGALYLDKIIVVWGESASTAVATTTTIDATGITNTDLYTSTAAGSLSATVKAGNTTLQEAVVTWESSDEDVATIDNSGVVTLVAVGSTTITAKYAGVDDEYLASSDTYNLIVSNNDPNIPGTLNNPYTVAQANDATPATGTSEYFYIKGIVSAFFKESIVGDGTNYRYYISDDGTTTDQLIVYKGKGLNNVAFTAEDDLQIGDEIVLYGQLTTYQNAPEVANGNYIVSLKRNQKAEAELSYATTEFTVNFGEVNDFTAPTLSNPNNLTVTYSSSDEDLALVDENTGDVTLEAKEGTVTITATFAGDNDFRAGNASYTITIIDPNKKGTFENPFTVAEVIDGTATGTDIYVKGFIVGEYVGKTTNPRTTGFSTDANIAIADEFTTSPTADESIPVALPTSDLKNAWGNKTNNGSFIGCEVLLCGNKDTYFTVNGIKNTTEVIAISAPASVTEAGWATWIAPFNVEVPSGVEAYYVTETTNYAKLNEVLAIPAGQPVLLKNEGSFTFNVCDDATIQAAELPATNMLKVSTDETADGVYVLANGTDGVGFYKWNGGSLGAGRVYLPATAGARDFIGFSFGEATGINAVENAKENGAVYNLAGQRVAQPTRGLYIVNGKKFVVK